VNDGYANTNTNFKHNDPNYNHDQGNVNPATTGNHGTLGRHNNNQQGYDQNQNQNGFNQQDQPGFNQQNQPGYDQNQFTNQSQPHHAGATNQNAGAIQGTGAAGTGMGTGAGTGTGTGTGNSNALHPRNQGGSNKMNEIKGKIEIAAGTLLCSPELKAKGEQREAQAQAQRVQGVHLDEAERLEQAAQMRRNAAVGHGAHSDMGKVGATVAPQGTTRH
jgi:uncharacterized protein YjbJ (UPF0337 family)